MPKDLPADFPILTPQAGRKRELFLESVQEFRDGLATGGIRNVVYQDAKSRLGNAVNAAWDAQVREPFFYAGKWEDVSEEIRQFDYTLNMSNLHDVISTSKKLAKTKLDGPVIDAMKAVAAEALPLAEASAELKGMIVKGRAPRPEAQTKPVNPNQIRGTCSCCFRNIAVTAGTMAHHGYERPGWGMQTSSCAGIKFPNLEKSTEGLVWLIDQAEKRIDLLEATLAHPDEIASVWVPNRTDNRLPGKKVERGDEGFDRHLRNHLNRLRSEVVLVKSHLVFGQEALKTWTEWHARKHSVEPEVDTDPEGVERDSPAPR